MATKSTGYRDSRGSRYRQVRARVLRAACLVVDLIWRQERRCGFRHPAFRDRHVAVDVEKVLRSAVANAENNGMRADNLVIKAALCRRGSDLEAHSSPRYGSASRILSAPATSPSSSLPKGGISVMGSESLLPLVSGLGITENWRSCWFAEKNYAETPATTSRSASS